ncbi:T6SS effector amidase Tae4 family protein [Massilia sp. DJPM01]|uniref:T6SS effector amidase Tae4 family protein n=1 Tax=Massilia sp. DJPM01 TaxID=3024404 RepID=UPI00259E38DF|nr:T6SS effector amidase Tae4 family protein [Massilia sp. DJPM01]MDM5179842.1 T6SS effector amidase Tae4 family protein [Massilia sp. DJPM01]
MKPSFFTVRDNYPARASVDRATLYKAIGWDALIEVSAYHDTCATRVSLALVRSGMRIPGRLAILKGEHKGSLIEPGHARLSILLQRRNLLGLPEVYRGGQAREAIGTRSGIVSFWRIDGEGGPDQGHIDIIFPAPHNAGLLSCGTECYWQATEVWFWPLV